MNTALHAQTNLVPKLANVVRGLRILLVGNDPEYFLMHRLALVKALVDLGAELHVAIPFDREDPRFKIEEFNLHQLDLERGSRNIRTEIHTLSEIRKLSKKLRPRLVHHITIKPVLYGSLVAAWADIPAVVNSITGLGYVFCSARTDARILRSLMIPLMRYGCNRRNVTMLFENEDDRHLYCSLGITEGSRSAVVPSSGVAPEAFVPHVHKEGTATVMFVGRMLWDKGVGDFVEAARIIKRQGRAARLVLVGSTDPNPASISEDQISRWHEEGLVEYWGWRQDMAATLRSADILCLPSYREGLPRSLLEGGAAGLALVTTDVPGCRDVVRSGVSGLIVPPRDPKALAVAISTFIDSVDARTTMGAAARAHVMERFSLRSVVEQTCCIYGRALERCA